MFDFRYHALSLVAVFLALGIGIVLGVTIGDSLVSEADRSLRSGLRGDVIDAREDEAAAEEEVERRDELIGAAFPIVAGSRLNRHDVAMVAVGDLPDEIESDVREAVEEADGELESVTDVGAPPDLDALGDEVGGRLSDAAGDQDAAEALGRRVGRAIVDGSRFARRLEDDLPDRFDGSYNGADSVVYWRSGQDERSRAERAFEQALLDALVDDGVPVVGVERSDADPSQVGFYDDNGLSSVDSVDLVGGKVALVLVLDGAGEGRFGLKDSAERPLPEDD